MDKTIYELDLHESMNLTFTSVLRVAGGWIYNYWDYTNDCMKQGTFVPYNKEFLPKKKTTPREIVKKSRPDNIFQVYFQFIINGLLPTDAWRKANDFMNHMKKTGWTYGKSSQPIKSWRAAVDSTWTKEYAVLSKFHRDTLKEIAELLEITYEEETDYVDGDILRVKKAKPQLFQAYKLPDSWFKYCGEK